MSHALVLSLLMMASTCAAQLDKVPSDQDSVLKRPVNVADSIGMRRGPQVAPVAHFSPDGSKFVVVVRRGNLQENTNEYSLLLWHKDALSGGAEPDTVATMSSSSNRAAIDEN